MMRGLRMAENVFTALSRYRKSEDYWTSALLYVLEYLWTHQMSVETRRRCAEFLTYLSTIEFTPQDNLCFKLQRFCSGRSKLDKGSRLDAEISTDNKCIWIEVKDEAQLGIDQLQNYIVKMEELPHGVKKLVLLRRAFIDLKGVRDLGVRDVRWFEVYDWMVGLQSCMQQNAESQHIASYLVEQFLQFLEQKGVPVMNRIVKHEFEEGVRSLQSLVDMLKQAGETVLSAEAEPWNGITDYHGRRYVEIPFKKGCYRLGIPFDDVPNRLVLWMDPDKVKKHEHRSLNPEELTTSIKTGMLRQDDDGTIASTESLKSFFEPSDKKDQYDELTSIIQRVFQRFEKIKKRKYERR